MIEILNRWSLIAGRIPGRTDNEIKNYWNTHLSKKLISQGIDPRTHKPLNNIPSPPPPPLLLPPPQPSISVPDNNANFNFYQVVDNNTSSGYYVGNCLQEDTFTTFLDSLMNDGNMFINNFNNNQIMEQVDNGVGVGIWDSATGLHGDYNAMGGAHHQHQNSS